MVHQAAAVFAAWGTCQDLPVNQPLSQCLPLLTKSVSISCAAASAAWGSRGTLPSHPTQLYPNIQVLGTLQSKIHGFGEIIISLGIFKINISWKRTSFLSHSYLSIVLSGRWFSLAQVTSAWRGHKLPAWKGKWLLRWTLPLGTESPSHPGASTYSFLRWSWISIR